MCTESDGAPDADLIGGGHRIVDRNRETLAAGAHSEVHRCGGGDPDDLPGPVHQRAPGVAGHHRCRELDQTGHLVLAAGERVLGVHGAAEAGHRPDLAGQRRTRALGVPERDDRFALHQSRGVPDHRRGQPAPTQ